MADKRFFLIAGFPCSGLKMIADFLIGNDICCYYDPESHAFNEDDRSLDYELLMRLLVSDRRVDTGICSYLMTLPVQLDFYSQYFPDAPTVIVTRNNQDVVEHYARTSNLDTAVVENIVSLMQSGIDTMIAERNCLVVSYDDVFELETLRKICSFVMPDVVLDEARAQLVMQFQTAMQFTRDERDEKIDLLEEQLAQFEQIECELTHTFTNGLYSRRVLLPADSLLTSKIHKTQHQFVVTKGRVLVYDGNGPAKLIEAPYYGITEPNTRRVLYTFEDTEWTTFHVTDKTTPEEVEADIILKRPKEIRFSNSSLIQ
jgi:hypothetical protein